jgi:hypothetical protein
MKCMHPIGTALLDDYWVGALAGEEEEAVEAHLFNCDECGERLRELIALIESVKEVARDGNLLMTVTEVFLNQVNAEGLHVREYAPPRGGSVQCTVSREDDFLIGRLDADLSAVRRLDLVICDKQGVEMRRLADIPFRRESGGVRFQQPIAYAKGAPSETMIARLVGIDDFGAESLVGEYTFVHTRTIAGPASW